MFGVLKHSKTAEFLARLPSIQVKPGSNVFSMHYIAFGIAALVLISLQYQFNIFQSPSYKGLRVNLADFFLPFGLVLMLVTTYKSQAFWPKSDYKPVYFFLLLLTALMSFSLIKGYLATDSFSRWAFINKYIGWYVLLSYFALGSWFSFNNKPVWTKYLFNVFVISFCLNLTYHTGLNLLLPIIDHQGSSFIINMEGFSANRNAYAFLILTFLSLCYAFTLQSRSKALISYIYLYGIYLTPIALFYNGSRTALFTALIITLAAMCFSFKRSIKVIFPVLAVSLFTVFIIYQVLSPQLFQRTFDTSARAMEMAQSLDKKFWLDESLPITSEIERLRVLQNSIALWKSSPITGIGLGTYINYSYEKYGAERFNIIDSSPLWLLTEMGLVGFIAFSSVFLFCFIHFIKSYFIHKNSDPVIIAAILIMISFGLMSILHELIYQRSLWLFIGIALACTAPKDKSIKEP
jgi:hypothetical protein